MIQPQEKRPACVGRIRTDKQILQDLPNGWKVEPMDTELRRKKLLYQANYRGFKEADLLFGGFAKKALATMSKRELDEFEELLKINDRELFDWVIGRKSAPANIDGPVFEKLRAFNIAKAIMETPNT